MGIASHLHCWLWAWNNDKGKYQYQGFRRQGRHGQAGFVGCSGIPGFQNRRHRIELHGAEYRNWKFELYIIGKSELAFVVDKQR